MVPLHRRRIWLVRVRRTIYYHVLSSSNSSHVNSDSVWPVRAIQRKAHTTFVFTRSPAYRRTHPCSRGQRIPIQQSVLVPRFQHRLVCWCCLLGDWLRHLGQKVVVQCHFAYCRYIWTCRRRVWELCNPRFPACCARDWRWRQPPRRFCSVPR